jgi:hypothetical protein
MMRMSVSLMEKKTSRGKYLRRFVEAVRTVIYMKRHKLTRMDLYL